MYVTMFYHLFFMCFAHVYFVWSVEFRPLLFIFICSYDEPQFIFLRRNTDFHKYSMGILW
jgi:hypothetical protein